MHFQLCATHSSQHLFLIDRNEENLCIEIMECVCITEGARSFSITNGVSMHAPILLLCEALFLF